MRILAIIPAFNESGAIGGTVKEVLSMDLNITALVVNDGSSDDTARVADEAGAHVVTLPFNLGIGGAVQTGFRYAYEHDYDVAVQVDGDGQHDASYIAKIVAPIIEKKIDICIGSRFVNEGGFRSSFARRVGIRFLDGVVYAITSKRITDPTSGFRAFGKSAIKLFAQYYPNDYPEPEAIVMAWRYGLTFDEVPVLMRARASGQSSIRYLKTFYYMFKVTFAMFLHVLHRKSEVK